MGNNASARRVAGAHPEPFAEHVWVRLCTVPLPQAPPAAQTGEAGAVETPGVSGCLRGVGWGLAMEGMAALAIYGVWQIVLALR